MICYLLKLSKNWQSYEYFNHLISRGLFVYICMQRDDVHRIQQRYFICRYVVTIPELHKQHVQGHCAAYHFRIMHQLLVDRYDTGNYTLLLTISQQITLSMGYTTELKTLWGQTIKISTFRI